jgi:pimeloyl-ACP methyl ester carboxylesterase
MDELLKQYFLPSSLSKYEKLHIVDQNGQSKILGVHFLEYSSSFATNVNFDALYVNHGFGASSLSWLPAIPSLTRQLKAKVCLGHDAVGLGFTERPEKDLKWFSTKGSATIGTNLLIKKSASTPPKSVALFGHSMGSLTTLKMALQLPKETTKLIVLCAPALGLQLSSPKNKKKRWWHPIGSTIRKGLVYPIITYSLRRVVG